MSSGTRTVGDRFGRLILGLVLALALPAAAASAQEREELLPDTPASPPGMSLEEAVGAALGDSRRIRVARASYQEAGERVDEAWGQLFPAVDLSMDYTRNVSPAVNFLPAVIFDPDAPRDKQIPVQFGADNTWNGLIDVRQAVFKPAVFVGVGAAARFEDLQGEVMRGEVQGVVTRVRTAYYDLLLAQEQVRLTENSVRRVRETLEETRALNRAGLSSDYDVLRLEVELSNLEPNLLRARNAERQARRQLGVLLDLESVEAEAVSVEGSLATMDLEDPAANTPANRRILSFTGAPVDGTPKPEDVGTLVGTALERRSDVRQAELTESLRQTEVRLEQVEYLPEISLFGSYQVSASQNGDPEFFGSPRAYSRRVGVQVTLPIFDGLARESRVDQKAAVLRGARAQTSLAKDQAESEVRTLVDQVVEARARAEAQGRAVDQAGRGFDIARAQYREGLGSQLEITDAEVALRQSEFNYAEAVYDYLTARARLDEATGRVPMADRVVSVERGG